MSEEVAQVLDRAHDIIVERGWCQGVYENAKGEVCSLGALRRVRPSYDLLFSAEDALVRAINDQWRGDISRWNDADGRTKRQVLLAFRRAAKAERSTP